MTSDTTHLRSILAAATQGVWARRSDGDEQISIVTLGEFLPIGRFASPRDAAAVCEVMNAVGELLDEVERLRADITMLIEQSNARKAALQQMSSLMDKTLFDRLNELEARLPE